MDLPRATSGVVEAREYAAPKRRVGVASVNHGGHAGRPATATGLPRVWNQGVDPRPRCRLDMVVYFHSAPGRRAAGYS